jgi:ribonuclease BN (tRNA processing enzyme)
MIFIEAVEIVKAGLVKELWVIHFSPSLSEPAIHKIIAKEIF